MSLGNNFSKQKAAFYTYIKLNIMQVRGDTSCIYALGGSLLMGLAIFCLQEKNTIVKKNALVKFMTFWLILVKSLSYKDLWTMYFTFV